MVSHLYRKGEFSPEFVHYCTPMIEPVLFPAKGRDRTRGEYVQMLYVCVMCLYAMDSKYIITNNLPWYLDSLMKCNRYFQDIELGTSIVHFLSRLKSDRLDPCDASIVDFAAVHILLQSYADFRSPWVEGKWSEEHLHDEYNNNTRAWIAEMREHLEPIRQLLDRLGAL